MSCGEHRCAEFACGFATARGAGERFSNVMVEAGTIAGNYDVWTTHDVDNYESMADRRKRRDIGIYHSLGFIALTKEVDKWPDSYAFVISPPTSESLGHMVAGGGNVLANLARGAVINIRHRNLLREGVRETIGHPVATVRQGLQGVKRDAIAEIAESYKQLKRDKKPEVHVIVSTRETLFNYDDHFEEKVVSEGFKLWRVNTGHNGPHIRPEEVEGVVLSVLNEN